MGADYSFYVKIIETHARAFFKVIIFSISSVYGIFNFVSIGVAHVIDPKAMSKQALYGVLDPNTREWRDGLFTAILRKIIDNVRGEINKRQWYIFYILIFSCNLNYFFPI